MHVRTYLIIRTEQELQKAIDAIDAKDINLANFHTAAAYGFYKKLITMQYADQFKLVGEIKEKAVKAGIITKTLQKVIDEEKANYCEYTGHGVLVVSEELYRQMF